MTRAGVAVGVAEPVLVGVALGEPGEVGTSVGPAGFGWSPGPGGRTWTSSVVVGLSGSGPDAGGVEVAVGSCVAPVVAGPGRGPDGVVTAVVGAPAPGWGCPGCARTSMPPATPRAATEAATATFAPVAVGAAAPQPRTLPSAASAPPLRA